MFWAFWQVHRPCSNCLLSARRRRCRTLRQRSLDRTHSGRSAWAAGTGLHARIAVTASCRKQYVRDHLILRTEAATNDVTDYGVNKAVENLPALRAKLASINDNYLEIQLDILETFVNRGQLNISPNRPTPRAAGASPASSSTTRGNWP